MPPPKDHIKYEQWKKNISIATKKAMENPLIKEKMRNASIGKKRKPFTIETRRRMALSKFGDNNPAKRPEVRKKIGLKFIGRKLDDKHKKKISEGGKRRFKNPLERKKLSKIMSEVMKEVWKRPEYRKKKKEGCRSGENSHFWAGGKSFEKYGVDWTATLRRSIRERDNYSCVMCGKLQSDFAFSVHHIDYDKKNCNPDNLITLCKSCHQKTNFDREKWIIYFSSRL